MDAAGTTTGDRQDFCRGHGADGKSFQVGPNWGQCRYRNSSILLHRGLHDPVNPSCAPLHCVRVHPPLPRIHRYTQCTHRFIELPLHAYVEKLNGDARGCLGSKMHPPDAQRQSYHMQRCICIVIRIGCCARIRAQRANREARAKGATAPSAHASLGSDWAAETSVVSASGDVVLHGTNPRTHCVGSSESAVLRGTAQPDTT